MDLIFGFFNRMVRNYVEGLRDLFMIVLLFFGIIGYQIYNAVHAPWVNFVHESAMSKIVTGDVDLIVVHCDDDDTHEYYDRMLDKLIDKNAPDATGTGELEDNYFYKVKGLVEQPILTPQVVSIHKITSDTVINSYYYAVFKGPNAMENFRGWLKNNGYENWNFRIEPIDEKTEKGYIKTKPVKFEGKNSFNFGIYTKNGDGIFAWDGVELVPQNKTWGASKNGLRAGYIKAYLPIMKSLAQ